MIQSIKVWWNITLFHTYAIYTINTIFTPSASLVYLQRPWKKPVINADPCTSHTTPDDHTTFRYRGNSPTRLNANVDSLCTSETGVTLPQKLSWLTHSNPQWGQWTRQQERQRGGGYALQVVSDDGQIIFNMFMKCKSLLNFTLSRNYKSLNV